jgi:hypothetical protein
MAPPHTHTHSHLHPPARPRTEPRWPGVLLCSGMARTAGVGALCGLMWLALYWAMGMNG